MDTSPQDMGMQPQKSGPGQAIGIVIIILIIVLGGIYFWMMKSGEKNTPNTPQEQTSVPSKSDLSSELDASDNTDINPDLQNIDNTLK